MDESVESVEKVLGSPVSAELSEQALKIRRNLLVVGSISIFIALSGAKLDPDSTVLGFKFTGVSEHAVSLGLTVATTYFLLHFLWYSFDCMLEWRLRVTGTRLAFVTGMMWHNESADYPSDPRQSTLYSWWMQRTKTMGDANQKLAEINDLLVTIDTNMNRDLIDSKDPNVAVMVGSLTQARTAFSELVRKVEEAQKTLLYPRIEISLKRFDGWFELFLRSQNLRWLLLEILFPVSIGGIALVVLNQMP